MKILYVSSYLDQKYFNKIFNEAKEKPIQNIQKFNHLFVEGMNQNSEVEQVTVITSATVNRNISNKLFWKGKNLKVDKVEFKYLPFINLKFIKQICIAFFSFFFILSWCIKNNSKDSVLISDGFYPIVSTIASIICKLFNINVVTLYTDLNKFDVNDVTKHKSLLRKIIKTIINIGDYINVKISDKFILLTEQMNEVVNKENKPYIVIEGLVDKNFKVSKKVNTKKNAIMYAGGLYEKYGVKLLIESFVKWNNPEFELWLCGSDGDLIEYIENLNNPQIKYLGSLPNKKVVKLEQECVLLINPRYTNEDYTKYSFPSKNMEYMLSGTPVLTTILPGMPKEYYDYVYLIDEETPDGIISQLNKIFKQKKQALLEFGKKAQEFVLKKKNNKYQGEKVINLIKENTNESNFSKLIYKIFTLFCFLSMALSMFFQNIELCKDTLILYFIILSLISIINYKKYLPFVFFLLSFFTFTMGQYLFDNINGDILHYTNYSSNLIIMTMFIQFICLCFSFLGYRFLFSFNVLKKLSCKKLNFNKNAIKIFKLLIFTGLTITALGSILVNAEMAFCTITNEYLALYNGTFKSIFPAIVPKLASYYFIFFAFFLSMCKDKKKITIAFIIFLVNGIINLLAGMRYEFVFDVLFLIFYVLLYHINNKLNFSLLLKRLAICFILMVPIGLIGLNLYNNIRNNISIKNVSVTRELKSFFAAQGRSINILTLSNFHKEALTEGNTSYVFGLFNQSLVDKLNTVSSGKLNIYRPTDDEVNLGKRISYKVLGADNVKQGHGLGSQFLAEIYLEGGILGIVLYSILLGYISSLFYNYSSKGFLFMFFCLSLVNPLLHISRSVAFELFAPFTSMVTILLLLIFLFLNVFFNRIKV